MSTELFLWGAPVWLYGKTLSEYIEQHKNETDKNPADFGIPTIESAVAIFGFDYVRAWTGGIPEVLGNCTEHDVKDLLYTDSVNWTGTRKS